MPSLQNHLRLESLSCDRQFLSKVIDDGGSFDPLLLLGSLMSKSSALVLMSM